MKLVDYFDQKPSEFITSLIAAIEVYMDNTDRYNLVFGKNLMANRGAIMHISEPIAMLSFVTHKRPEDFSWPGDSSPGLYEDWNEFAQTADWVSVGCPFVLFEYLGIRDQYVHPDRYWILINGSWKEHIQYLKAYCFKLINLGL
jgi:hypothetical protein